MSDARVLVVDDSAAMRALFADILEQTKGVTVVGMAVNADDARSQLDEVRPNVIRGGDNVASSRFRFLI